MFFGVLALFGIVHCRLALRFFFRDPMGLLIVALSGHGFRCTSLVVTVQLGLRCWDDFGRGLVLSGCVTLSILFSLSFTLLNRLIDRWHKQTHDEASSRAKDVTWEELIEDAVTCSPVSIEGAIERAIWGKVQRFESYRTDLDQWSTYVDTTDYFLGWLSWNRGISSITIWNDDPDTTTDSITLLLRKAADDWEEPPF
ncbi:DUF6197 family protein [Streptomyces cellostaticus]